MFNCTIYTADLAEFELESDVMELEMIGVVRVYFELLLPVDLLDRNVTIQLDTRDGTATGSIFDAVLLAS